MRLGGVLEKNQTFYDIHHSILPYEYILALSHTGGIYKYIKIEK